jgi:hypothetical protein
MTVYLCGPINDCTDSECKDWRNQVMDALPDINFLDPMVRDYRGRELEEDVYIEIVENDKTDILNSDVVFVYHDKPSVGTSMEVLFAYEQGLYIIVLHITGKPLSPWMLYHSTEIVKTLEEGIEKLKKLNDDFPYYSDDVEEDDL